MSTGALDLGAETLRFASTDSAEGGPRSNEGGFSDAESGTPVKRGDVREKKTSGVEWFDPVLDPPPPPVPPAEIVVGNVELEAKAVDAVDNGQRVSGPNNAVDPGPLVLDSTTGPTDLCFCSSIIRILLAIDAN